MPGNAVSIVEVDLSGLSPDKPPLWRGPYASVIFIIGSLFAIVLIMAAFGRRGAMAGLALLAIWLVALVVFAIWVTWANVKSRAASSTTGVKVAALKPGEGSRTLPGYDRPIEAILQALRPSQAGAPPPTRSSPEARRHAAVYRALAGGVFAAWVVLAILPPHLTLGGLPVILTLALVFYLLTRARRALAPPAEQVLADDPRPAILFLRSFQDDEVKVGQWQELFGLIRVQQKLRFEEALADMMRGCGPFLAIGEPSEGLPQLGAARAYPGEEGWRTWVQDRIQKSQFITMLCGPTQWVHWEVQNIVAAGRLHRFLLYLPPGRGARAQAGRRRIERWENIVRSLEATPYGPAMAGLDISEALLIRFQPDGALKVFRSRTDAEQDYELATALAVHELLAASEAAPDAPPDACPALPPASPPEADAGRAEARAPRTALWATFAAFGFASGLLHLLGSAGLHGPARLLLTPITPAALTLAAYLFHSRDPRFLLRFAGGLLAGAVAAALLVPMLYFLIGRRLPWGVQPAAMSLMAGVVLPALMAGGLAAAFPAYRRRRFWRQGALLIGPAVLVVAVLTLARARGLAVVGSLAVWTLAAAWIGRGLNALSGDR